MWPLTYLQVKLSIVAKLPLSDVLVSPLVFQNAENEEVTNLPNMSCKLSQIMYSKDNFVFFLCVTIWQVNAGKFILRCNIISLLCLGLFSA